MKNQIIQSKRLQPCDHLRRDVRWSQDVAWIAEHAKAPHHPPATAPRSGEHDPATHAERLIGQRRQPEHR
ncbi:MAG: hypothetical protein ACK559_26195, partial [bacterium]